MPQKPSLKTVFNPLTLPCGLRVKNRIAKAAMTEGIADVNDDATKRHERLYSTWAKGGAGMLLTGNVMIDRRYLERAGNVVVDDKTDLEALRAWAAAGKENGSQIFMQISHPGRQCTRLVNSSPVAPSAVQLNIASLFAKPRALTDDEIEDIIKRWVFVAKTAKDTGFSGVQIHSAHGYLCSQFLSPHTNRRTDKWGGSLENRARFLMRLVDEVRAAVGDDYPVAVKLNSSDFQKGGFSDSDAATVAKWLAEKKIDFLEISGGTYENVAFLDADDKRPNAREAYFLEYAKLIREAAPDLPLMVTGGFRTASFMEETLASGQVDLIGIGRPFCFMPDFPNRLAAGEITELPKPETKIKLGDGFWSHRSSSSTIRGLNSQTGTAWFYEQIYRLADGIPPETEPKDLKSVLFRHFKHDFKAARSRSAR